VSENPKITLTFTEMFCSIHGEPFREQWPKGVALAQLGMFNAALRDDRIIEACGRDENGKGDGRQLNRVLREFGPMCCFLEPETVANVTMLALVGAIWGHDK
jgi:hypothetical protein